MGASLRRTRLPLRPPARHSTALHARRQSVPPPRHPLALTVRPTTLRVVVAAAIAQGCEADIATLDVVDLLEYDNDAAAAGGGAGEDDDEEEEEDAAGAGDGVAAAGDAARAGQKRGRPAAGGGGDAQRTRADKHALGAYL